MINSIDWISPMQQTYEFYIVDPGTWLDKRRLTNITSFKITRNSDDDICESASFSCEEWLGEFYIRVYLIATQNKITSKIPLGTFLAQTCYDDYDGKVRSVSYEAYSPLIELKEKNPPIGYAIIKNRDVIKSIKSIIDENVRAPIDIGDSETYTSGDRYAVQNLVADPEEKWLTYCSSLLKGYESRLGVNPLGHITLEKDLDVGLMSPVWTFNDDNSSILQADITVTKDLYNTPNVVEVIHSTSKDQYIATAVNDDKTSPVSIVNRGRKIVHREIDDSSNMSHDALIKYAKKLLQEMSSIKYELEYTHGYCPVRVGDCVRLNYRRAGLNGINAKVVSQSINCQSGCLITEKSVFTEKLWRY